MKKIFRNRAFKALICVIVALSLGAVIAAYTHNHSTPLSSATSTVLHPLQRFSSYLSYKFSNFNDSFKSSSKLAEENRELKEQIEEYQNEIIDYNNIKEKLKTYEDFLGVKEENPDFKCESATIISNDFENPFSSFTLNKGSANGIKVNDPVIYGKNLVGVVASVGPTSCTVYSISNPKMNVSVYETYTGEIGYVTGLGKTEDRVYCKLPGLKSDSSVSPSGIICTTGSGGIYPKDLIVGTVVKLESSKEDGSSFASIRSSVNIEELSEVFIITEFEGQGVITITGD